MNQNQTTTAGPGEQVLDQLRRLRRSRDDKVIAGVCGGLGRSLGVDPLLLRVVLAVLVLFGGTGVVLYAIAWLLLPLDDGTPSVGAQALDRSTRPQGVRPAAQSPAQQSSATAQTTTSIAASFEPMWSVCCTQSWKRSHWPL